MGVWGRLYDQYFKETFIQAPRSTGSFYWPGSIKYYAGLRVQGRCFRLRLGFSKILSYDILQPLQRHVSDVADRYKL